MNDLIFRKGDTVRIEALVTNDVRYQPDAGGELHVTVDLPAYQKAYLPIDKVELVQPFFKPGEKAVHPDFDGELEVVHIEGSYAWVKNAEGFNNVVLAGDLQRPSAVSPEEFAKVT